jgi:DNA-binding transcriptional MerR regulator
MPYDTYRLYQVERPKNFGEIRQADEQAAQFVSAVSSLFSGFAWPVRRLAAVLSGPSRRRGQFQLDAVRIFEPEHVNASRRQFPDATDFNLTWSALRVPCSATMNGIFSPSEAAEQSGFSLETLRYYERIGLLDGIDRAPSGHRRFRGEDLEWLGVLRCLRETGMPIAQMRRYADLARCGDATLVERMNLLTEHELTVQAKIALLQAQQEHLREKIDWYREQLPAAAG